MSCCSVCEVHVPWLPASLLWWVASSMCIYSCLLFFFSFFSLCLLLFFMFFHNMKVCARACFRWWVWRRAAVYLRVVLEGEAKQPTTSDCSINYFVRWEDVTEAVTHTHTLTVQHPPLSSSVHSLDETTLPVCWWVCWPLPWRHGDCLPCHLSTGRVKGDKRYHLYIQTNKCLFGILSPSVIPLSLCPSSSVHFRHPNDITNTAHHSVDVISHYSDGVIIQHALLMS